MRVWEKRLLACVLLLSAGLFGCGRSARQDGQAEDGKLNVVTTLFPYYDLTREIAGDAVTLSMVIPAGMDSHSFEPTPADIRKIQGADILIRNGGAMEFWLDQVLDSLDTSGMVIVTMMEHVNVVEEELVEGMEDADLPHSHGAALESQEGHVHAEHEKDGHGDQNHAGGTALAEYDEHIWTSPVNAMKITEIIAETLIQEDKGRKEQYEAGRDACLFGLEKLDEEFRQVVLAAKHKTMIMGDKFPLRYFADEYGLQYWAAFSGCSADTEPAAKTIAYLIDKVREEGLGAVYYLELSSPRVAEIISEETGARPLLFHSCHNVTRREFESGVTYLSLMEKNVAALREGLGK